MVSSSYQMSSHIMFTPEEEIGGAMNGISSPHSPPPPALSPRNQRSPPPPPIPPKSSLSNPLTPTSIGSNSFVGSQEELNISRGLGVLSLSSDTYQVPSRCKAPSPPPQNF